MDVMVEVAKYLSQLNLSFPMNQLGPILAVVGLLLVWGKYKTALWMGFLSWMYLAVTTNKLTLIAMLQSPPTSVIVVMFLTMTTGFLLLFTVVHQGHR
ncbi:hypothetical protein ACTRW9_03815 [Nitrospina sp. 32_T5]|uniref:hypothetical protein n=1 Tax=unclassified Nitrospina TaxID=2638683 RepID=UPI003F999D68